jgi:Yip1-like protein
MMIQGVSVGDMLNQSMTVLTKPSVQSFEQFEKRGGQREALIYVGVAAAIGGILSAIFGLFTGGVTGAIGGLLAGLLLPLISFFVSAWLIYTIGKSQGGTGTQDEVFYTVALYLAPILAINGIIGSNIIFACLAFPVSLALGIYGIYLGYLAIRASMNLDQNKAIITMVLAFLAQLLVSFLVGAVLAAIGFGAAAATGGLNQ